MKIYVVYPAIYGAIHSFKASYPLDALVQYLKKIGVDDAKEKDYVEASIADYKWRVQLKHDFNPVNDYRKQNGKPQRYYFTDK